MRLLYFYEKNSETYLDEGERMKIHGALRVLEKKEMYNIHQAVIEVLHNPGIKLENQQALEQLNEKGVKVDFDSQIVKLEPYMIEETIRQLIGSDSLRITPNGVDAPEEISYTGLTKTEQYRIYVRYCV